MLPIILTGVMMIPIQTWNTLAALSPPDPSARSASLQRIMHYSIYQVIGVVVDPMAPDPGMFRDWKFFHAISLLLTWTYSNLQELRSKLDKHH